MLLSIYNLHKLHVRQGRAHADLSGFEVRYERKGQDFANALFPFRKKQNNNNKTLPKH